MKTKIFNLISKKLIILSLLFITVYAYSSPIDTTITRSFSTSSSDMVSVSNSNFDVDIQTWDKNSIEVKYSITVDANKTSERDAFLKAYTAVINKKIAGAQSGKVSISEFFSSVNQNNNEATVKFDDGQKFKLNELKGTIFIHMPKNNALDAKTNFHSLTIADLNSDVTVSANSSALKMGNCKKLDLNLNFGKNIEIGNVESAEMELNSSNVKMGNIATDLSIKGNFSDIEVLSIGNLATLSLNSSSFKTTNVKTLDFKGNFVRSFAVEEVDNAVLVINSSEFKAKKINSLVVDKINFSTVRADEVVNLKIGSASSSKFYIGQLNSLESSQCNFCNFNINQLEKRFVTKANSGSIKIENVAAGFDEIKIDGQFVTTEIHVANDSNYKIVADFQFPKYKFNNITYEKHISEMSHETMQGWHGNKEKATSTINLDCQSCNVTVE